MHLRAVALVILVLLSGLLPVIPLIHRASASWPTQPTQVTNDSIPHVTPSAAQDSKGNVYLFWAQNPGISYVITNTTNIARNFWPAPLSYSTVGQSDFNPSVVALKNGTIVIFLARLTTLGWSVYYAKYNNGQWSSETLLTSGPPGSQSPSPTAIQDSTGRLWVAWTKNENGDLRLKFVDTNSNGVWNLGEPIVYDSNNNGLYDTGELVIYGSAPSIGTPLNDDPRIKFIDSNDDGVWEPGEFVVYDSNMDNIYDPKLGFIDSNNNNVWDPGETMVYDADSDGLYSIHSGVGICQGANPSSDCIILGSVPATNNTIVNGDAQMRFVDPDADGAWRPGDAIIYDSNNNGQYDSGERPIGALVSDSKLKFIGPGGSWAPGNTIVYDSNGNGLYDSRIKFVNATNNPGETWAPGKAVVYDKNLNGIYDPFDTILSGQPGLAQQLRSDPRLKFVDANGDGTWNPGEAVIYDSNLNGVYDTGDLTIYGINPPSQSPLTISLGEAWVNQGVAGVPPPIPGASLKSDPKVRFVDLNVNGQWDLGEPVAYDSNNNGIADIGESSVGGILPGTRLITSEAGLGGIIVSSNSSLSIDGKIRFLDSNANGVWDPGETVIYDSDNNAFYTNGRFHNDTVILGPAPANITALATDSKLKYVEFQSPSDSHWETGETVVYDSNGDNRYESAEPVVTVFPSPSPSTFLSVDSKIKYWETDGNNVWDPGETAVYDKNNNGAYDANETVISGQTPGIGTPLSTDSQHIKFVDTNGDGAWARGEVVVYDSNHNGLYDSGEAVIGGALPTLKDPAYVVSHIFYKVQNGSSWSAEQRLTGQPGDDHSPTLSQMKDGRVWVTWSGDRTLPTQILYRTTSDGNLWTPEALLYNGSTGDSMPSMAQDRNGTIWAVWAHNVPCGSCGLFPYQLDIYSASSADNAATWSLPADLTLNCSTSEGSCTSTEEVQPKIIQLSDKKLYIFFSVWSPSGCTSCLANLFYLSNPIFPVHDAQMNGASMSTANLRAGQKLVITANVTNAGDFNDTMTVTVLANNTAVATNSSLVRVGQTVQIPVSWTTGVKPGRYLITIKVSDPGESPPNQMDNALTISSVLLIRPRGDVNGDCTVDILDLVLVASIVGSTPSSPKWNPNADLNNDLMIDITDLVIAATTFGQTC